MGLKDILNRALGDDGRSDDDKREDAYQRAEGMVEPGSSITRRAERRESTKDDEARFVQGCAERIGFAGLAVATVLAACAACVPDGPPPRGTQAGPTPTPPAVTR